MGSLFLIFLLLLLLHLTDGVLVRGSMNKTSFDQNYEVTWGGDHVVSLNQGKEIHLTMDNSSGSGFGSKMAYGSGLFNMMIKVPGRNSAGVVTAYYLTSQGKMHDELDFEFLGNRKGKPYRLQTNVFVDGQGNREQRHRLWFDPTADFHNYKILWNQHQIVFYVDNIPIRVYKNKSNIGVGYPSRAMQIEASLWDAEWATNGGKTKTDWSYAPFKANFKGFDVSGCYVPNSSNNSQHCSSDNYWWNREKFWQLDPVRERQYEHVKHKYMTYDYCADRNRYPETPLECL